VTIRLDQHLGLSNTSIVSPVGTLTAAVDPIRFDQSLGLNAGILSSPVNLSIGTAGNSSISARVQQPAMPVIGFLRSTSPDGTEHLLAAFRQGLKETRRIL
jgi:hypothetical protein